MSGGLFALLLAVVAPSAVSWSPGGAVRVAAIAGDAVVQAVWDGAALRSDESLDRPGLSALGVLPSPAGGLLVGARGAALLRLDSGATLARLPAPIRQLLPATEPPGVVILTGTDGDPAPAESTVWWLDGVGLAPRRVTALEPHWRTWRIGWARCDGQTRLVAATYKATRFLPFLHRCLFVFEWSAPRATAWWLGSRLSRPYQDATHGDLRADGADRLVSLEADQEGDPVLAVYRPIGFGYEGEWSAPAPAGASRVVTVGDHVLVTGRSDAAHWARQLVADGAEYRLSESLAAAPDSTGLVSLDPSRLAGYWGGQWRVFGAAVTP